MTALDHGARPEGGGGITAPAVVRTALTAPARAGLALVAAAQAEIGVWGTAAPHSLFTGYPGAGHHWLSQLGAFNEHLVRDFAGAELGLAVLLAAAALWPARNLVLVAGAVFLAATLPHFAYHLTTMDSFSTADDVASLGGFVLELAIVGAAIRIAARTTTRRQ